MKVALVFLAALVSLSTAFVSKEQIREHIHDLQSKLCTGKVPVNKLKEGEACHAKLVPKDFVSAIEDCEKETGCKDVKNLMTGHKKHDIFLCCWCSEAQQDCLFKKVMMMVMTFQINPMNIGKDLDAFEEDLQCIAKTVGAKVAKIEMGK